MVRRWSTPSWQGRSEIASQNRQAHGFVNHSGGPVPTPVWEERLAEEMGRQPGFINVYDRTHKRKGTDEYIDERADIAANISSRVAASDEEHISKYTAVEMEQAVLQTEEKMRQEMHQALEQAEKRHQDQMRQQLERADQRHQKQMQALATGLLSKLGLPSTTFELPIWRMMMSAFRD